MLLVINYDRKLYLTSVSVTVKWLNCAVIVLEQVHSFTAMGYNYSMSKIYKGKRVQKYFEKFKKDSFLNSKQNTPLPKKHVKVQSNKNPQRFFLIPP